MPTYVTAKVLADLTGRSVYSIYRDARNANFPTRRDQKQCQEFFSLQAAEQRYGNFQPDVVLKVIKKHSRLAAIFED